MIELRPMEKEDLDVCTLIVDQTMGDLLARSFRRNLDEESFDSKYRMVAIRSGEIVGLGGVVSDEISETTCWVAWFAVKLDCQGQGVGKMLMDDALAEARSMGYQRIYVETYDAPEYKKARDFYSKMGFVPVGYLKDALRKDCSTTYMGMEL